MKCPNCHVENINSAKFCKHCGGEFLQAQKHVAQTTRSKPLLSRRKIMTILAIIAGVSIVGVGAWFGYDQWAQKKYLDMDYLKKLAAENSAMKLDYAKKNETDQIDQHLDKAHEINKKFKVSTGYFVKYAKGTNLKNDSQLKEFIEKRSLLDEMSLSESDCKKQSDPVFASKILASAGFNKQQNDRFMAIQKKCCEISRKLDDVEIEKDMEKVKGSYDERENANIPKGFTIVSEEPQNGEAGSVVVLVHGETKGMGNITVKEPINGVKLIGTGDITDIAKKAEDKLREILALWSSQNFTADSIAPFLDEKNKDKSADWEDSYKKIAFNWRRFESANPKSNDASLKEHSYSSIDYADSPVVYLPVEFKRNSGSLPTVPFFYDAKSDSWVSQNDTIAALFDITSNQSMDATITPEKFHYNEDDDCDPGWFSSWEQEITLSNAKITGKSGFSIQQNALLGHFTDIRLTADGFIGEAHIEGSSESSLDQDLINYVNQQKKNELIIKSLQSDNGDCKYDKDILLTIPTWEG